MGERGPNATCFWWVMLIGIPAWLFVLSAFLRLAVWAANKCRGHLAPVHSEHEEEPDDAPRARRYGQYRSIIPAPRLGGGAVIASIALVLHFVFGCVTGAALNVGIKAVAPGGVDDAVLLWTSRAFALAVGFFVWWGVVMIALPTSFGRAALVTLFLYLQIVPVFTILVIPGVLFGGR